MNLNLDIIQRITRLERRLDDLVRPEIQPFQIGCRVYNNANVSHTNDGGWFGCTFNSERFDTADIHSVAAQTHRLTAPIHGYYAIWGHIAFANNANGSRGIRIRLNATTTIAQLWPLAADASVATDLSISTIYELDATDYVSLEAWQDSGGNLNMYYVANRSPEFGMMRLA